MKLRISYDPDPEVDVLNIALARRRWVGRSLAANSNFVVQVGENGPQDVVGAADSLRRLQGCAPLPGGWGNRLPLGWRRSVCPL